VSPSDRDFPRALSPDDIIVFGLLAPLTLEYRAMDRGGGEWDDEVYLDDDDLAALRGGAQAEEQPQAVVAELFPIGYGDDAFAGRESWGLRFGVSLLLLLCCGQWRAADSEARLSVFLSVFSLLAGLASLQRRRSIALDLLLVPTVAARPWRPRSKNRRHLLLRKLR